MMSVCFMRVKDRLTVTLMHACMSVENHLGGLEENSLGLGVKFHFQRPK